ncbi:MAG: AIR synthase-related protein [Lachnospiraceae bacterium]|nr:AIR synthase-related protein [Lachnospiraceae bacterium]
MRTGKLAEAALKRSVLRQLDTDRSVSTERYGADCAVLPQKSGRLSVYTAVSAVPGFEHRPELLVTAAVNNLAAGGAEPEALTVHALVPADYEEAALKKDIRRIAAAARHSGMEVLCGHTEVSEAVNRPLYQITGIGSVKSEDCRAQEKLRPGDALVMTKWIALAGTAALAERYEEELGKRFPFPLIDRAKEYEGLMSVAREARAVTRFGVCAMHDLSQGGIFGALWEMAERAGAGLEVDLKKIPVKQETIEICEYFDINPYNLYSAGSLLVGTNQPEALIAELSGLGIFAAVIGRVTEGNDRIIRNGEDVRFLDRPQQEEWYRRIGK